MIATFAYWGGSKEGQIHSSVLNNYRLSFLLAKKHFHQVHLITDDAGEKHLGSLGWDGISKAISPYYAGNKKKRPYGKLVAIKESAKLSDSFILIEDDCFLWKKPKKEILEAGVFSMCEEIVFPEVLNLRRHGLANYQPNFEFDVKWMPNLAICGGTNTTFWIEFADAVLSMMEDESLNGLWEDATCDHACKRAFSERWLLAAFLTRKMKSVSFVFPNAESPFANLCQIVTTDAEQAGVSWLANKRNDPEVIKKIARRLAKNPPDLSMNISRSLSQMASNLAHATIAYAEDGFENCTKEEHAERLAICRGCEYWDGRGYFGLGKCRKCGCSGAKLWLKSSHCPIAKW